MRHRKPDYTVRPSPPMRDFEVSAILREVAEPGSGKSQFRRPLKPQPMEWESARLPFAIGDLLWCREAWIVAGDGVWTIPEARMRAAGQRTFYRADGGRDGPWWSSVVMPREFSRLTLEVVDVKVERLQAIGEEDARAEGMTRDDDPFWRPSCSDPDSGGRPSYRNSFEYMWDQVHGPGSWSANPFVCAVTFRQHLANVEAFVNRRYGES